MVLEREILPFWVWLLPRVDSDGVLHLGALLLFFLIVVGLAVVSVFLGYLRMMILQGPGEGFYAVAKSIATAISRDFPQTRMGRILAMARLAIQESLRRRVLVAFFVFAVVLLFAGWFLDPQSDHPARLYLGFVLSSAEPMILILAILLSVFSLPNDIKNHTIYTVVTKPVRASEIVLGRILGFCTILTFMLVVMCAVSYVFVIRGLDHTHTVHLDDMVPLGAAGDEAVSWTGETSRDAHHRHEITIGPDGFGQTDRQMDHEHSVWIVGEGDDQQVMIGPPRGALVARVPIYGTLRFKDRTGRPGQGISVGKEWTYRQYIEGGSLAAGVWTFDGITPERYPEGYLPLEMTLGVFRTYKGDIVSPVLGALTVKNPSTGLSSEPIPFGARDFVTLSHQIPQQLRAIDADGTLRDVDLFEDLVDEQGRTEIWVSCEEPAQYFGMAQADLYIRGPDRSFAWNFVKGYMGIWLQMIIITCFGVMFSTFLSGPVAMVATFMVYMVGMFKEFIMGLATGELPGGGPVESLLRTALQMNITIELDMGPVIDRVVPAIDRVLLFFMWVAATIFPDFGVFNTSRFVAYGFNISGHLLAQQLVMAGAFVVVLSIYGYFFLKSREVAA